MCLSVTITAPPAARTQLETAAASLPVLALHLKVEGESRLPRVRDRPVRAWISETGGCACSLLADDADWNAGFWSFRPEIVEPLARMVEAVAASGVSEFSVEASWGEAPLEEREVSPEAMSDLARTGQIGSRTRYLVRGAGARG